MITYEVTPADFPEVIWSTGSIHWSIDMGAEEFLVRLSNHVRGYRRVDWLLPGPFGFNHQIRGSRFKLWENSWWDRGPLGGAFILDASIRGVDNAATIQGEFRIGYPFVAIVATFPLVLFLIGTIGYRT